MSCLTGATFFIVSRLLCQGKATTAAADQGNTQAKKKESQGPSLKPAEETAQESEIPFLQIRGSRIVSAADGSDVLMHGVCVSNDVWTEETSIPAWISQERDFTYVSSLNMNVMRYALNYHWFEDDTNPFVYRSQAFLDLDERINWARSNGISLVLDMHHAQGGLQERGEGNALWEEPQNQARLIALWQAIASRYNSEPVIIGYDLLNEPHPFLDSQWQSLAQDIATAIRQVDQNHILFVANTFVEANAGWENFPYLPFTIDDPNAVYTAHFYVPVEFTHQGSMWGNTPQGAHYPDVVINFKAPFSYETGYFDNPGVYADTGGWVYLEGDWAYLSSGTNKYRLGQVVFQSINEAGDVWIDNLQLEICCPGGYIRTMPLENTDFHVPLLMESVPFPYEPFPEGYYPSFWDFSDVEHIRQENNMVHLHGCELCEVSSRLLNNFFPIIPGYEYRISGWVNGKDLGKLDPEGGGNWNFFMMLAFKGQVQKWDRAYLEQEIEFFSDWAEQNSVPFYIGEFGTLPQPEGTWEYLYWVRDITLVMQQKGLHWTYWSLVGDLPQNLALEIIERDMDTGQDLHVKQPLANLLAFFAALD